MEAGKCEDEKIAKRCMKTCDMCEEEPKKSNYFKFTLKCNISSFLKKVINILSNQKSSLDVATYKPSSPDIYSFLRLSPIMRNYKQYDYYKSMYFLLANENLMILITFNFVIKDHQKKGLVHFCTLPRSF